MKLEQRLESRWLSDNRELPLTIFNILVKLSIKTGRFEGIFLIELGWVDEVEVNLEYYMITVKRYKIVLNLNADIIYGKENCSLPSSREVVQI